MSGLVLGIDPGTTESAYSLIASETRAPVQFGKVANGELLGEVKDLLDFNDIRRVGIEMVASYGMAVGKEVFETCVWIGRFQQTIVSRAPDLPVDLIYRRDIKLHHCGSAKAKDSNITQALVDRFAPGAPNHGKGTKADPAWFYGFRADIWQAYALTVLIADQEAGR